MVAFPTTTGEPAYGRVKTKLRAVVLSAAALVDVCEMNKLNQFNCMIHDLIVTVFVLVHVCVGMYVYMYVYICVYVCV